MNTSAIVALLDTALSTSPSSVAAFDGPPTDSPDGPYAAVFDDPGNGRRIHYDARTDRVKWTHRVMAVARTRDGLRWAVTQVRDALTDTRPSVGASMLSELSAGPVLTDGPDGDRRHSMTITYTHTTPRSAP